MSDYFFAVVELGQGEGSWEGMAAELGSGAEEDVGLNLICKPSLAAIKRAAFW